MARTALALAAALQAVQLHGAAADVAMCPGEGDRYGDHKCNHDPTHRVCAQLLDGKGQPLSWGPEGDFWNITRQTAWKWDGEIRANKGDSWCICMWAAANLIAEVGCDNVHLRCEASDIAYIEKQYADGGVDLAPAKHCLQLKCPSAPIVQQDDATAPRLADDLRTAATGSPTQLGFGFIGPVAFVLSFLLASVLLWRMRSGAPRSDEGSDAALSNIE